MDRLKNRGPYELRMTEEAEKQIDAIMSDRSKSGLQKQLKKCFRHLAADPLHRGLQSHPLPMFEPIYGTKVFSSYVQNQTPQAYRVLWAYGPQAKQITLLAVIPHY